VQLAPVVAQVIFLALQSLGYRARLSQHVWLIGASLAALLVMANPQRCALECSAAASMYEVHELIAAPLRPLQRLMVFAPWYAARESSCTERCLEAHTFVQVRTVQAQCVRRC
jgi:hypothetical protein